MNFDDVMVKFRGKWDDGRALIIDQGGYIWCIAEGDKDSYALTRDGQRFVTDDSEAKATVKRARKAKNVLESVDE